MSTFSNLGREGSGAHLSGKLYPEWHEKVKGYDSIKEKLDALAQAAAAYDDAIMSCANNPEKMASFCTAQGDDLDALYANFITLARGHLKPKPSP